MTIEPNNIKNLQQRNYKLVVENEFLKEQNTQLKHKNKQQAKTIERLITIIKDEHYN